MAREVKREDELGPNVSVSKPPGPLPLTPLGRLVDRVNLYMYSRRVAYREVKAGGVLAVHHCGPCGDQSPSLIGHLPIPFVYGPMPAPRPIALRDDEWVSWLRTPQAGIVQTQLSRMAAAQSGILGKLLVRSTIRRADAVTVEARSNAIGEISEAVVIPPGIDAVQFAPGLSTSRVRGRVIAVGRLLARKGYDILIRALARIVPFDQSAHLLIVGAGPEEESLRLLARSLGVDPAVTFVGDVPRTALPSLLRSAEVFCQPAIWDNVPFAPLEAMACGVPTVVSAAGGLPDLVGEAGVVHQVGNDSELSAILIDLLSKPSRREALGEAARARILQRFTWQIMCDSYIELYSRLAVNRTHLAG